MSCYTVVIFYVNFQAWKREVVRKHPRGLPKDYEEGFEVLEAEEGAGWDLVCQVRSGFCNIRWWFNSTGVLAVAAAG
jgi:hypothetical protein